MGTTKENCKIDVGDLVHVLWAPELKGIVVKGRDDGCYNVISNKLDTGELFIRHEKDLSEEILNQLYKPIGVTEDISIDVHTTLYLTEDDMNNVYREVEKAIYEGGGSDSKGIIDIYNIEEDCTDWLKILIDDEIESIKKEDSTAHDFKYDSNKGRLYYKVDYFTLSNGYSGVREESRRIFD